MFDRMFVRTSMMMYSGPWPWVAKVFWCERENILKILNRNTQRGLRVLLIHLPMRLNGLSVQTLRFKI